MKALRCFFMAAATLLFPGWLWATQFVVFGDSLSDLGNVYTDSVNQSLLPDPPPTYYQGRMSNGPIWVDYLADSLQIARPQASQSAAGATGYAYAGSAIGPGTRVRTSIVYGPAQTQVVANSGKQIDDFLAAAPGNQFTPDQFVLYWSGAQNLLQATLAGPGNAPTIVTQTLQQLEIDLRKLNASGAQRILVPNQIDSSIAPYFNGWGPALPAGTKALLSAVTNSFNAQLNVLLNTLRADPTIQMKIYTADVDAALDAILADPAAYGFDANKLSVPLALDPNISNPAAYLFWDPIHPTTQSHARIAATALRAIPNPGTLSLAALALAALMATWSSTRRQALRSTRD